MAEYVFKVQVLLPGNILETVILRQYIDPVDRCFDKFKNNLIQRYDVLNKVSFKIMWIDPEGDKISIFNEEDLRTFMEMKGAKVFVEVDDGTSAEKGSNEKIQPVARGPLLRACGRGRWDTADRRSRFLNEHFMSQDANGSTSNAAGTTLHPLLHVGVQCDGCDSEIRGYRYKCIECPDFDLCFACEMKKLHGDHMMIRIVKPLDRPFNRHFLKAMMKQRCLFRESFDGKEKEKECRRRHSHHNKYSVNFDDIMADIAKNISSQCVPESPTQYANMSGQSEKKNGEKDPKQCDQNTESLAKAGCVLSNIAQHFASVIDATTPANNGKTNESNGAKSNEEKQNQFALNTETFTKAGVVLSNLAQHFASVMDPFAIHEFTSTTPVNSNEAKTNETQSENAKSDEPKKSDAEDKETAELLTQPITPTASTLSISPPISTNDLVTIEDLVESPVVDVIERRESSPIPDWALVDANGQVEENQPKHTGAIPKNVATPIAVAQPLPNYAVLARDLQDHLQNPLKSQASQTPPLVQIPENVVHHPNPRINEAIFTMTSMGFSNGGGWLTRLLENVDGDIPKALEKLHPSQ